MVRLGEAEGAGDLALGHLRQVLLLLFGGSKVVDGTHGQ